MGALVEIIKDYFNTRGLVWPNFDNAMKFAQTELAEVYEIDLARETWVRNNPEDKPKFNKEDLAKELGDAIMMLIVAGIAEGVDPVEALLEKIGSKVDKEYNIFTINNGRSLSEKEKTFIQSKIDFGNSWD